MRVAADLRAFAIRRYDLIDGAKTRYWVAWKRARGAAGGVALSEALRRQVRDARPDWPSEAERLEDLRAHVRMSALLQRVPVGRR